MRLVLGTVQFGLDYGATNNYGQTSQQEVESILKLAQVSGIETLDTAVAYGVSEKILGQVDASNNFLVITKLPPYSRPKHLRETVQQSLNNLKMTTLDGLMCHRASDYIHFSAQDWQGIKDHNLVRRIGVSVYTSDEIEQVLHHHVPDIVQLPINIFDQRLIQNGALQKLKDQGIEVYARSLFLQGILINQHSTLPGYFSAFNKEFSHYAHFLKTHNLTPIEASLAFAQSISGIDYGVFGVNTASQLEQIVYSFQKVQEMGFINSLNFSTLASDKQELIDPQIWQL